MTTQLQLRRGLAWILTVSWAKFKLQKGLQIFCMATKLLHRRTGVLTCAFFALSVVCTFFALSVACTKQVFWEPVHAPVCRLYRCFLTSVYMSAQTPFAGRVRALVYAHICSLVIGGQGWGGSASLCRTLVAWHGELFLTEGEIWVLSCFFSIFDAGGSVWVCMCVYAHTRTYCTWGTRCEPRGRDETLQGPNILDGRDLGIFIFEHVYKVHMCIYTLGCGMRSSGVSSQGRLLGSHPSTPRAVCVCVCVYVYTHIPTYTNNPIKK